MKCAGCQLPAQEVLKGNPSVALCAACIRVTNDFAMFHRIRNPIKTISIKRARRPDCVSCGTKIHKGHELCILCLNKFMSHWFHDPDIELDNHPLIYRLCGPAISWAAAWETRVNYQTDFARVGMFVFYPRGWTEKVYIRFDELTGIAAEPSRTESLNNSEDALDFLL